MSNISRSDVEKLLKNPCDQVRAETAEKIANSFANKEFSPEEKKIAEKIFSEMANDAAQLVRKALSESLQYSVDLPHDVAKKLADDIEDVALPILKNSQVLTDEDLVEIVKSSDSTKQVAIAQREGVSSHVSEALIETDNKEVVQNVIKNNTANISENSFQHVFDKFSQDQDIQGQLVKRKTLPLSVTDKLISVVSDSLKKQLVDKHNVTSKIVDDVIRNTRERAIVALTNCDNLEDVEQLVKHLVRDKRLSASILLRALCMGYLNFFEMGLAELGKVPVKNVRILIHDSSGEGLRSVMKKAKISDGLFSYFRIALSVIQETVQEGIWDDFERYHEVVIERFLTQIGDQTSFGAENIDYLLGKLDHMHRQQTA